MQVAVQGLRKIGERRDDHRGVIAESVFAKGNDILDLDAPIAHAHVGRRQRRVRSFRRRLDLVVRGHRIRGGFRHRDSLFEACSRVVLPAEINLSRCTR